MTIFRRVLRALLAGLALSALAVGSVLSHLAVTGDGIGPSHRMTIGTPSDHPETHCHLRAQLHAKLP